MSHNPTPLMIENIEEFFIGDRFNLRVQITQPGDPARGVLDYGFVSSPDGTQFQGYIGSVRSQNENIPNLILDSGTLTMPNGKIFTGEFHVPQIGGEIFQYLQIPTDF